MSRIKASYKTLEELQKRYQTAALLKPDLVRIINESEIPEHVYNSNAIENNTLSLEETDKILMQIELDRFITEREIFEAKNLARVVEYLEKKAVECEISEEVILLLHKMLISNINDSIAGRFRKGEEWVRVGSYIAANPAEVPSLIQNVITDYKTSGTENIIRRISKFHLEFEHIHPFCDGNGRIGRVLINYLLIRNNHVPVNIKFIDRQRYYEAFKEYDQNQKTAIMEEMVLNAVTISYQKRLAYLEGMRIITLNEYAKEFKLSLNNVVNKAKRQTIPAFIEKGVWKIGVDSNKLI